MRLAKPRIAAQLSSLLAFAGEVARNALAEVRWHRQREPRSESTYRPGVAG
jgi:hypothetical protein